MKFLRTAAGLAVLGGGMAAASGALAAPEEIQVYMDEMNPRGGFGLDVHLNYSPEGRGPDVDYAGEMTSERRWRITPEWSYGLTDNIELGLYLPLAAVDPHDGLEWDGVKARVKFIAPHAKDSRFFWGVNYELGRVRRSLDINPWNAELKFIGGYREGPWTLAGNVNVDWMVSGPEHTPVSYQLATKASYRLQEGLSVGLESYNDLGDARHFGRFSRNDQSTYVVADKSLGKWDLNLGVGYGYGRPEDRWILKAIVGVPVD